jgi:hypothetical protein
MLSGNVNTNHCCIKSRKSEDLNMKHVKSRSSQNEQFLMKISLLGYDAILTDGLLRTCWMALLPSPLWQPKKCRVLRLLSRWKQKFHPKGRKTLDFRLLPRSSWDLRSSGILRGVVGQETKSYLDSWPVKMGPIRCPKTSVNNYHSTQLNIPEQRRSGCKKLLVNTASYPR